MQQKSERLNRYFYFVLPLEPESTEISSVKNNCLQQLHFAFKSLELVREAESVPRVATGFKLDSKNRCLNSP